MATKKAPNLKTGNTLIIWEEIPEKTTLFVVPNEQIDSRQAALLREASNKFINADDENDGMIFLNNALSSEAQYCIPDGDPADHCIFAKYRVEPDTLASECGPINRVILSGFMM